MRHHHLPQYSIANTVIDASSVPESAVLPSELKIFPVILHSSLTGTWLGGSFATCLGRAKRVLYPERFTSVVLFSCG